MGIKEIRAELEEQKTVLDRQINALVKERKELNTKVKTLREELAETERFLKATKPRATKKAKADAMKETPLETGV